MSWLIGRDFRTAGQARRVAFIMGSMFYMLFVVNLGVVILFALERDDLPFSFVIPWVVMTIAFVIHMDARRAYFERQRSGGEEQRGRT